MGCDVHVILEQKDKQGDWYGVRTYDAMQCSLLSGNEAEKQSANYVWFKVQNRNYQFFGDLADVRMDGEFGHTPRGLPPDMSAMTRDRFHDDPDLHSCSWLKPSELEPILAKHFSHSLVAARLTSTRRLSRESHPLRCFGEFVEPDAFNYDQGDSTSVIEQIDAKYRLVFCFDN